MGPRTAGKSTERRATGATWYRGDQASGAVRVAWPALLLFEPSLYFREAPKARKNLSPRREPWVLVSSRKKPRRGDTCLPIAGYFVVSPLRGSHASSLNDPRLAPWAHVLSRLRRSLAPRPDAVSLCAHARRELVTNHPVATLTQWMMDPGRARMPGGRGTPRATRTW